MATNEDEDEDERPGVPIDAVEVSDEVALAAVERIREWASDARNAFVELDADDMRAMYDYDKRALASLAVRINRLIDGVRDGTDQALHAQLRDRVILDVLARADGSAREASAVIADAVAYSSTYAPTLARRLVDSPAADAVTEWRERHAWPSVRALVAVVEAVPVADVSQDVVVRLARRAKAR